MKTKDLKENFRTKVVLGLIEAVEAQNEKWQKAAVDTLRTAREDYSKKSKVRQKEKARRSLGRQMFEEFLDKMPKHAAEQSIYDGLLRQAIVTVDWTRIARRFIKRAEEIIEAEDQETAVKTLAGVGQ